MIVPPFFGLHIPSRDRSVYGLRQTYLANDVLTYSAPTEKLTISYILADVLSYTVVDDPLLLSMAASDILSYTIPSNTLLVSTCSIDVLSYDPPAQPPDTPHNIIALDGDSIAYLTWSAPYNNRSPLIDYIIEYRPTGSTVWIRHNDLFNTQTSLTIDGLVNNTPYEFRIAAVNNIGIGLYGLSNPIVPTSGNDDYCSLKLLIQPNSSNVSDTLDLSCSKCSINHIGVTSDSSISKFGGVS